MLGIKQQETAKAYDIGAKFNERTLETFLRQVISMLSIAVCDDEILECCRLAQMIKDILDAMGLPYLLRQFGSGKELLQAAGSFDILFLDILMADLDGMETARRLREKSPGGILIFLSSSRDYVWDAYDVEAFHYLLKPLNKEKLQKVLQRAARKAESRPQEFLFVGSERQKEKLFLDGIYYFEIQGRIVDAHGTNGVFSYYGQIGALEKSLQGKGFFRCHKSYLLNLSHVDGYNSQEAILDNGERIVIAKRRYGAFCREMLAYMKANGGIF
jgi:DNA-binding LytR/AlgR family response regulator